MIVKIAKSCLKHYSLVIVKFQICIYHKRFRQHTVTNGKPFLKPSEISTFKRYLVVIGKLVRVRTVQIKVDVINENKGIR